ncbi:AraC family transcriptional regulator [Lentilactobacillus buchneri subsp. silagei]|uniref:AraC family transcriptional regulator n=1 Tax=Lentilactobacillus buchneri TaxID=1581 RepID=UPI003AFB80D5
MRIAFSNLNDTMPISCESIGYHWRQYPIYRPNGYRFFHWLQTESSSGTIKIDGQQIHLLPNSGILIRPTVPHSYSADSDAKEWDTAYITFYGPLANYLVNYLEVEDYRVFEDLPENITNFIQSNYRAFINNTIADQANQSVLIYRYLLLLHQMDIVHGQQSKSDPIVNRITSFLESNYQFNITNQSISNITGLSIPYQTNIFRQKYGVTPLQYLFDYRIRQAAYLLVTRRDLQVQEVSEQVGFSDTSRFINAFRNFYGVTPNQYSRTAYQGNN